MTGARLREILTAKWSYLDFERGIMFLPDSKTGKKPIYLSAAALAVLDAIPRMNGNPYIIPGAVAGAPRHDLKRPWMQISKAAGLGWRAFARFAAFLCLHRGGCQLGTTDHWQAVRAFSACHHSPLQPFGRGPDAAGGRYHRKSDCSGHGWQIG